MGGDRTGPGGPRSLHDVPRLRALLRARVVEGGGLRNLSPLNMCIWTMTVPPATWSGTIRGWWSTSTRVGRPPWRTPPGWWTRYPPDLRGAARSSLGGGHPRFRRIASAPGTPGEARLPPGRPRHSHPGGTSSSPGLAPPRGGVLLSGDALGIPPLTRMPPPTPPPIPLHWPGGLGGDPSPTGRPWRESGG